MIGALALDDLLAHLTPEVVAAVTTHAPAGFLDQVQAATGESVGMIEAIHGKPVQLVDAANVGDWLRLGLLDGFCRWAAGTTRTCMHAPTIRNPQPVWSCAWRPDTVVCTACLPLLRATGVADRTCDFCGQVCDGPAHGDGIHALTIWLGAFAYQAGACRDCVPAECTTTN
jgi:hypothetical protein